MKKIIALLLVLALIFCMAMPASAITTGKWDFNAAQQSANQAAAQLIRQESVEDLPDDHNVNWKDYIHRWLDWWVTVKE